MSLLANLLAVASLVPWIFFRHVSTTVCALSAMSATAAVVIGILSL